MATTNEDMYMKDWMESIPQMTTEELLSILSKEQDYNPQYVEIVKEEYAKRPQVEIENIEVQPEECIEYQNEEEKNIDMPKALFILLALIGLAGVGSLRYWNVPFFILCMYCVWLFIKRKENSLYIAKAILVISFLSSIVSFFLRDSDSQIGGRLLLTIVSISLNLGCLYYLDKSEDVNTYIPRDSQYLKNIDCFLIALPVLFYLVGLLIHF